MSTKTEEALKQLLGRDPTTEEVAKIYKLRETLGLSDNDPVWTILTAYSHFEILFAGIPEKIVQATKESAANHRMELDAQASASIKMTEKTLGAAVRQTAEDLARTAMDTAEKTLIFRSKRHLATAIGVSFGAAFICLIASLWIGANYLGPRLGDKGWLATPDGRAARRLADLNNLPALLQCSEGKRNTVDGQAYCNGLRIK